MRGTVLIVDDDEDVSGLVAEVLREEGFAVTGLVDAQATAICDEVARLEPDVVLLDGWDKAGYGQSWTNAAWLHERGRPIAVIMFTAHAQELAEAQLGQSERSQRAAFMGFISKPFDLQVLIDMVGRAADELAVRCVQSSPPPSAAH
jgi:DNA-binding NtrC family response regulator